MDNYVQLCSTERRQSVDAAKDTNDDRAREFRALVRRGSVAVVGPAPCGRPQGSEIDDFDVVVRVTYWGADHLPPCTEHGARTDVSYYNHTAGCRIAEGGSTRFLADLKFSVFKNPTHVRRNLPSRAVYWGDLVYFVGNPNMIQVICFDLMHFCPARVKLFGVNFFLSQTSHHQAYRTRARTGRVSPAALADHDLLAQLYFVRNLYRAGQIEADEMCAGVLEMTDREYLRGMEEIYWGC